MTNPRPSPVALPLMLLVAALTLVPESRLRAQAPPAPPSSDRVLDAKGATAVMPTSVFFRGQSATVQLRNSGGVHFADDAYALFGLVDTSGYSSGLQERYQGYLITEVPLDFAGHTLTPGAYGVGFREQNLFLVMDLGAHDLFTAPSARDAALKRAVPLQVTAEPGGPQYRLYFGRNYVVFSRARTP